MNNIYWQPGKQNEVVEQEHEFQTLFRQILVRNGMKIIGQLISDELRGQAKLLEDYNDRESQRRLILAAELVQDTAEDVTAEYGI